MRPCAPIVCAALALGAPAAHAGPPPSLGDALRDIGALDEVDAVDPLLVPPPPPAHIWPELVVGAGAALVVGGIVGMLASPTCATRDGAERCVDPRGSAPLWPALVVIGLGATISGSYWYRWTRLPDEPPPGTAPGALRP